MKQQERVLFSGGAPGAEAEFGSNAEKFGIEEVNFSFEGHRIERRRGVRNLTQKELEAGDVSLAYLSRLMNRRYSDSPTFRKILQTIWHQINSGQEIFVIGVIQPDQTVRGGTGWGAEFAKICNKPLHVYDKEQNRWFTWNKTEWVERRPGDEPVISQAQFTGTGTRTLTPEARRAIEQLFVRSFPR